MQPSFLFIARDVAFSAIYLLSIVSTSWLLSTNTQILIHAINIPTFPDHARRRLVPFVLGNMMKAFLLLAFGVSSLDYL
jgi:hypothetical protein